MPLTKSTTKKRKGKRLTRPKGGHTSATTTAREKRIAAYGDVMLMMCVENGIFRASEVRRVCWKHGRDLGWLTTKEEVGGAGDEAVYFCDG